MSGRASRSYGIHAEVRLKRILEGLGAIVARCSMSQGPFDLVALGTDDVALIEVKAVNGVRYYPSKSKGTAEAVFELARIAEQCAENVFAVVAVYFGGIDDYRYFSPERILRGPVSPEDADFEFALACDLPPVSSSPSVGSPRPEESEAEALARKIREAARTV